MLDFRSETGVGTSVFGSLPADFREKLVFGEANLKFGLSEGIFEVLGGRVVGVSRRSGHCDCSRSADVPTGSVR